MATSKRLQVGAAIAAVVLLGGAYVLTVSGEDGDGASPATSASTGAPGAAETVPDEVPADPASEGDAGALRFTDATVEAGFDEPHASRELLTWDGFVAGVAVADYDADGDQDVYLPRIGLPNRLLRNDGDGRFTDVAEEAGATGTDPSNGYAAAVWADTDGDGDLDLFLTGAGTGSALLLVNDGTGRFVDGTRGAGLGVLGGRPPSSTLSYGATLHDWDRDGDLDLVALQWYRAPWERQLLTVAPPTTPDPICSLARGRRAQPASAYADLPGSRSMLLANDGTGRFSDVTETSGVDVDQIIGFQPLFSDVDGDGWDDLFITGDYCTSRLYRNLEGTGFEDITDAAGVGKDQNGMGSVVADLDGDGNLDWFVSSIADQGEGPCGPADPCQGAGNRLYLGDGAGSFTDATDDLGVRDGSWGWGAVGADLDQDGRLDLALANGQAFNVPDGVDDPMLTDTGDDDEDPTRLWRNTGAGPWPDVSQDVGVVERANGKGIVAFDADGDGDLDLLIANTEAAPTFYRNDTPTEAAGHWLQLRLRAPGTRNPFAVGARVTVDLGDGSPPRVLDVRAGGSYQSSDPTDLHVGLGDVDRIARIEVRWPDAADGPDAEPTVLTDVEADQLLEVERG